MKREEEKIRNLFQQLKEDDGRSTSSFTQDWNNALSRLKKPRRRWAAWQLVATAMLILLVAGWWMFFKQPAMRQTPIESVRLDSPSPAITQAITPPDSPSPAPVSNPPNVTRQKRPFVRRQSPVILLSQWRSPTESLLRIPGEQLFKRVPRLDESLINIGSIITDQKN